jgi:hypothetical protein
MRQPEITTNSIFGRKIIDFIREYKIKSVIEIGSGSGNGSTQCFIESLKTNGDDIKLYCFEPQPEWFKDLVENTKQYSWITCYNNSAINYDDFLIKDYYNDFWNSDFNHVKNIENPEYRKKWYDEDITFFKNEKESVLPKIKAECVLIDGCEFSGYSEYKKLNSSVNYIILDDCFSAFKTKQIYLELIENENWILLDKGIERNGWSIFKKIIR